MADRDDVGDGNRRTLQKRARVQRYMTEEVFGGGFLRRVHEKNRVGLRHMSVRTVAEKGARTRGGWNFSGGLPGWPERALFYKGVGVRFRPSGSSFLTMLRYFRPLRGCDGKRRRQFPVLLQELDRRKGSIRKASS